MSTAIKLEKDFPIKSCCRTCYWNCPVVVHRKNGVIVRIEGNPDAPQTGGRVCPKGQTAYLELYDSNRVKAPLKRTNSKRGVGVNPGWEEIQWNEALDIVAENLRKVRRQDPRQLFFNSAISDEQLVHVLTFKQVFGCDMYNYTFGGAGTCGSSEHAISRIYRGANDSMPDPVYTKYCILVGTSIGFGTHLGGAVSFVTRMAESHVDAGMKVVVVDPRCSEAAAKDDWIPIRPGTDLALLLSMIHIMLHELKKFDAEFVKNRTNGPYLITPDGYYVKDKEGNPLMWDLADEKAKRFNDTSNKQPALEGIYEVDGLEVSPAFHLLKEHVREYTPEWAEEKSTVPASTIRRLTQEFVEAANIGATIDIQGMTLPYRPVCLISYNGSQKHRNGSYVCMAQNLVNILVGAVDVPGGSLNPHLHTGAGYKKRSALQTHRTWSNSWGMPAPDGVMPYNMANMESPPGISLREIMPLSHFTSQTCSAFTIGDSVLREKLKIPYEIKAMITHCSNPFKSLAAPQIIEKAYNAIPFHASIALWMDDPTDFADVVLPEHHWLERLHFQYSWHPYFRYDKDSIAGSHMLRQPAVDRPIHNTKQVTDILMDLAERLEFLYGKDGFLDMYNQWVLEDLYQAPHPFRLDINKRPTMEELTDITLKALFGEERDLEYFKVNGLLPFKIPQKSRYWMPVMEELGYRIPLYVELMKRTGDVINKKMRDLGVEWDTSEYVGFPRWLECPHHKDDPEYELELVNYKTAATWNASGGANALTSQIFERDPYLLRAWIHTDYARKKGIKDGDDVWVESRMGKVKARAKVSECIHPSALAIGGNHGNKANRFSQKGPSMSALVPYKFEGPDGTVDHMFSTIDYSARVKVYKA